MEAANALTLEAEPAVKASKVFLMEKLVDLRQMPAGPTQMDSVTEFVRLQARVDKVALKITQLKVDTVARKTAMLMPEVFSAVAAAEAMVAQVVEAAKPLCEGDIVELSAEKLKAVRSKILKGEKPAASACAVAKKVVEPKQKDPRARTSMSFRDTVMKLANRLATAEADLSARKDAAEKFED